MSQGPAATAGYFRPPADRKTVRLIPLGGCGEFGMNLTAYLQGGRLYVVDCGVRFPDPARLGVDSVLPNVDPHFSEAGGVEAYFLTHGHEDHIGAMPHILPKWPAPVFGSAWSIALLKLKLAKLGLDPEQFTLQVVKPDERVKLHEFDVEFIHVNHSIPQTCMLFIRTPGVNIFHTGDFKLDPRPIGEPPTDLSRLASIGREGVDVMLADSTNAEKAGKCLGEETVLQPMIDAIGAARSAVLLTTFSSNLWRLKTIADACMATNRKLYVTGNGIEQTLAMARDLHLYQLPDTLRLAEDKVPYFPRERLVVLATGCQGESRSAMNRIATGAHRTFKAQSGDTVLMSARVIPGNEKPLLNMTNLLQRSGARIVSARDSAGLHVSGHAYGGDLDELVKLLKPRRYLPVHGAFSQLRANLHRLASAGEEGEAHLIETGDVLDLQQMSMAAIGKVEVELTFVDSEAAVLLPYTTLRDRLRIGELGAALMTGVYAKATRTWVVPPTIELIGLALPRRVDSAAWLLKTAQILAAEVPRLDARAHLTPEEINDELRMQLRRQLATLLKKKPVATVRVHMI